MCLQHRRRIRPEDLRRDGTGYAEAPWRSSFRTDRSCSTAGCRRRSIAAWWPRLPREASSRIASRTSSPRGASA